MYGCYDCLDLELCFVTLVRVVIVKTCIVLFFFFQAEDGIRDLVRSRGLGDVYKRQVCYNPRRADSNANNFLFKILFQEVDTFFNLTQNPVSYTHLTLPTSDLV